MTENKNNRWEGMTNKKIPSYMVWSIVLTFCFIPFGIVAIVYSSQVTAFLRSGDYVKADKASKKAKKWCWITFVAGLISALYLYL